jgi:hypothetical protein
LGKLNGINCKGKKSTSVNANATWIVVWTRLSVYCPSFADYENFYPKEKKEIPKGKDQKLESKGEFFFFCFCAVIIFIFLCISPSLQ